jgi:methionyl-tRNA formyltransferase
MARIVFMGTPDYAIPSLHALVERHEVALVVTQPDRRQGRGRKVTYSPVKAYALEHDLVVWQPATLRMPNAVERLRQTGADLYVTAAIGLILPADVLALPPHGCLNVHASLLPRWRGAAPIAAAILHGDDETGVTLMQTDEGLDTGPIVAQARCPIRLDDTTESLTPRLAQLGADLLIEVLPRWMAGEIEPRPQPEEGVSYAPRLSKRDGQINWQQPAPHIERMVRAYTPWPGTYTIFHGQRLLVHRARALPDWQGSGEPGRVVSLPDDQVAVLTGQGALQLLEIQQAGRNPMPPQAFVRGHPDLLGATLGTNGQPPWQPWPGNLEGPVAVDVDDLGNLYIAGGLCQNAPVAAKIDADGAVWRWRLYGHLDRAVNIPAASGILRK